MSGKQAENLWPTWLACLLSLYPAYWLASFLLFAAPALFRVAFAGDTLSSLSVSVEGIRASSRPRVPSPAARGPRGPSLPFTIGAAVVLGLIMRRHTLMAGLMLAMIGAVGAPQSVMRMFFMNQWNATDILVAVFFFVLLCTGLRFMLRTLGP